MQNELIKRRKFLKTASCGAIASTTLMSTLFNLKVLNAASIANSSVFAGNDYKALVCILLSGGNDSYNMLIPSDTSGHKLYSDTRKNLAIPKEDIHKLNGTNFGVHPSMPEVKELFDNQDLSFISNVGTLLDPVKDKFELRDGIVKAPIDLFSHQDQTQQWMTSIPNDKSAIGWGGKIADLLEGTNTSDKISMNISLAGSNVFQRGVNSVEYSVDPVYGSLDIVGYQAPTLIGELRTGLIDNMIDADYQDKFQKSYVDVVKFSRDASLEFSEALENSDKVTTVFSDTDLSTQLKTVANIISARKNLGMQRQIFFVESHSWDHHDYNLEMHASMLKELSSALGEFNAALNELNISDCVTSYTMSEFGRTLTSNGDGSDHAWGGNVMVMGGPVKGGRIFGEFPELEVDSDIDVGGGVLIPSVSVDEYFAELSLWFGIDKNDLHDMLPNLSNFYSSSSSSLPIGFLNI